MANRRKFLSRYALRAGISKEAARKQLRRVGIDYLEPFDFDDADRRRAAARHAARLPFAKPIYADLSVQESAEPESQESSHDPLFAESQRRREFYLAELARFEYEDRLSSLISTEEVEAEGVRMAKRVRDVIESIPSRIAGMLAAESDQRKVYDLLAQELRQALEGLARAVDNEG